MARASTLDRLQRLDLLESRLKSGEPLVIAELAGEFGVSGRTLARDIALLRERGLPIESDRGRGGGVRVAPQHGVGRIQLNYREAVDLLVSLAAAEQMNSPVLLAHLAPIRHKLIGSFSPASRHRIQQLRRRILVGGSASWSVLAAYTPPARRVVENVHQSFLMMKAVRIAYRDEHGRDSDRVIEPHYLLLNSPIWYVLAWDSLRGAIRTFRFDRMRSAHALQQDFRMRDLQAFRAALEGSDLVFP